MKKNFVFSVLFGAVVIFAVLFGQPATVFGQGTTAVPVYRFYFNWKWEGPHLYRTVANAPGDGWQAEGKVFYISPVQLPYTVPLYVVYSPAKRDTFYTVDILVRDALIANQQYGDQGVFGYVMPLDKDVQGTVPLYRWVRAYGGLQDHFYQTSASPVADYKSEGIECRVWTEPLKLPDRLIELSAPAAGYVLRVNETAMISWKVWSNEGYIRLSYSTDNGSSWQPIATVPNTGNSGDINKQSYSNWKVPAEAVGKILIKVDWVKEMSGSKLPWATDTRGPLAVSPANFRIIRRP